MDSGLRVEKAGQNVQNTTSGRPESPGSPKVTESGVKVVILGPGRRRRWRKSGHSGQIPPCLGPDSLTLLNSVTFCSSDTRGEKNPGKTTRARTPAQGSQNHHFCHPLSLFAWKTREYKGRSVIQSWQQEYLCTTLFWFIPREEFPRAKGRDGLREVRFQVP